MRKSAPESLIQCACKDLFWTFEFFTIKEEVLDFSKKGLLGEMTMAHFNIEPKNRCQLYNQYQSAIEEGIAYSRQVCNPDTHRKGSQE